MLRQRRGRDRHRGAAVRGFCISSLVPSDPITEEDATALDQSLKRLEALWILQNTDPQNPNARMWELRANVDLVWSPVVGAVDGDPKLSVVQLVATLPAGTPDGVIAYHTLDDAGRPLCLISFAAAGSDWPSAMAHELHEARQDGPLSQTARAPDGSLWDLETDDSLEGSDYTEPGTTIMVSNAAGPRYFGLQSIGPLDIREAMGLRSAVAVPFQQLPTGYHVANGVEQFGDRVTATQRAHVLSDYGRPGQRRKARA